MNDRRVMDLEYRTKDLQDQVAALKEQVQWLMDIATGDAEDNYWEHPPQGNKTEGDPHGRL